VIRSRRIRWAEHVARTGEIKNAYILVGKPEGKRPLGRSKRRYEYGIRMDLRGIVDWMHLAQDREQWRALL